MKWDTPALCSSHEPELSLVDDDPAGAVALVGGAVDLRPHVVLDVVPIRTHQVQQ